MHAEQGEARGCRLAVQHRMTRRCTSWDYRARAIYQITLVQADRRRPALGRLVVENSSAAPEAVAARVEPSALGAAILAHWKRLGDFTPEIRPLFCQLMPDHLHGILEVTRPMAKPLGNAIGGFKTGCEKIYRIYRGLAPTAQNKAPTAQDKASAISSVAVDGLSNGGAALGGLASAAQAGAICEALGKSWVERDITKGGLVGESTMGRETSGSAADGFSNGSAALGGLTSAVQVGGKGLGLAAKGGAACSVSRAQALDLPRLWAPGFQDSILFRAGQLDAMFNYLRDNPRRLAVKRLYPDLFRTVGVLRRPLPGLGGVGAFAALGNRFLLDRPLVQVQVSRRDFAYRREPKTGGVLKIARDAAGAPCIASESTAFTAKCDTLLARARQSAVLLSPCVSEGEREVARRAFAENLPLVVLRNKGFAPLEKPSGRYFDACAEGRLLLLAPAAWPHVPGEKPMTRRDALVLNRLAQALAGDGAAAINYRGVTFADVEVWAREAVEINSYE